MFRKKKYLAVILIILSLLCFKIFANTVQYIVEIDGKAVEFNGDLGYPYHTPEQRIMIPVRVVSENMGYTVDWKKEKPELVKIFDNNNNIDLTIGENTARVNGVVKPIDIQNGEPADTKSVAFNGRTYVPVRFVAEAMGAKVDYEKKDNIHYVYITIPKEEKEVVVVPVKEAELVGNEVLKMSKEAQELVEKYHYGFFSVGSGHYLNYKTKEKPDFIEPIIYVSNSCDEVKLWFALQIINQREYREKDYEIKFECISNSKYNGNLGNKWYSLNGYYPNLGLPMEEGTNKGDMVKYEISFRNDKITKVYPLSIILGGGEMSYSGYANIVE